MEDLDATLPPKRVREPDAPDLDATLPPKRVREPENNNENYVPENFDPERTIPNRRLRRERGIFSVGDLIANRYEIIAILGRGAMGIVYRCFDKVSAVEVALKGLPPELAGNEWEMKEIRRNFQLVHNLHHPNIASYNTLEFDHISGSWFLVMEYIDGIGLRQYCTEYFSDHASIINVLFQIASALDYAHSQQILHRDIKPGNIMVDYDGVVKILDFGLAAQIHTSMTRMSIIPESGGTAPYMSPEQWRGKRQSAASDQYALAVVAYEMFAGFLPFESTDMGILREVVLKETHEPLANVTPSIQFAVNKALSKAPEERFESCTAFALALTTPVVIPAPVVSPPPVPVKSKLPLGKIIIAIVAALLLLGGGIGIGLWQKDSKTPESPKEEKAVVSKTDNDSSGEDVVVKPQKVKKAVVPKTDNDSSGEDVVVKPPKVVPNVANRDASGSLSEQTFTVPLPNGVTLEMVRIPNCARDGFMMGSPSYEDKRESNETQHKVYLTKDFYLGKYEVTQALWKALMGNNPSYFNGANRPVEKVSYNDVVEFCEKLTALGHNEGWLPNDWKFTLPTEAQWEYACRAGTTTAYSYGNSADSSKMKFYEGPKKGIVEVGSLGYKNDFDLYDMHGNVWEWCLDYYNSNFYSNGATTDPLCTQKSSSRVLRGGSWYCSAQLCRSAYRLDNDPASRLNGVGFRLALVQVD